MARAELLRLVPTPLLPMPARDQYIAALVVTGLATSEPGRAWRRAADAALLNPVETRLQHSRQAIFTATGGEAVAWRFAARRGQRLTVEVETAPGTVFIDLFNADGNRLASAAADGVQLSHVIGEDGDHIARVQLPLGASGTVGITQRAAASLRFPVQGVSGRAVGSGFGVARDSGARRHDGIDIFAPGGTPVVAAADGWITRQTTNRLGGNVVWIWTPSADASLYYAHLERRAVDAGERVRAGDVVGYVGNTGNARSAAPHLHFGIYTRTGGVVDPLPYVVDPPPLVRRPSRPAADSGSS
jgi:murein DD-endopeptidase MepM/ murein hydrolase activator NlpD